VLTACRGSSTGGGVDGVASLVGRSLGAGPTGIEPRRSSMLLGALESGGAGVGAVKICASTGSGGGIDGDGGALGLTEADGGMEGALGLTEADGGMEGALGLTEAGGGMEGALGLTEAPRAGGADGVPIMLGRTELVRASGGLAEGEERGSGVGGASGGSTGADAGTT
jgi:hypothetical protein